MLLDLVSLDNRLISSLARCSENRVRVQCDTCGFISITAFANYTHAQERFPDRLGRTYCRICSIKASMKKRVGIPSPMKGIVRPNKQGVNSATWKGGSYIGSDGYKNIYMGNRVYRKEHVVIMEKTIGRQLIENEIVHHIDGNKLNNKIENLWLTYELEHKKIHTSLIHFGYLLIQKNLVIFDKKQRLYMANDKLRELLEQPEKVNQQPNQTSNSLEGSTTSCESITNVDNKTATSAGHSI